MFFVAGIKVTASLSHICLLAGVTCKSVYATAFMRWGWGVGGGFCELSEGVGSFECNFYVCVFEQVCDFPNLGGAVCKSCPFFVFFLLWSCRL